MFSSSLFCEQMQHMIDTNESINDNKCITQWFYFPLVPIFSFHHSLFFLPSVLCLNSLLDQPLLGICGLIRLPG